MELIYSRAKSKRWIYNTTSPIRFRGGIRFGLCCVHSPLLTASQLISSPAPTQMFQLRAFPTLIGSTQKVSGVPIRKSTDQRFHAPPRGLSQLGTSFIGPRAQPSTKRHSNAKTILSLVCQNTRLRRIRILAYHSTLFFLAKELNAALHSNSASKDNLYTASTPAIRQKGGPLFPTDITRCVHQHQLVIDEYYL